MDIAPFAYFIRAIPPLMVAWLAWAMARAPLQERANRVFALFLAVIAAGFLLEFVWHTLRTELVGAATLVRSLQDALGVVDPPILLAAVLLAMDRRDWAANPLLWVGYGVVGAVLLVETSSWAMIGGDPAIALHVLYVNGTYFAAFLLLLAGYRRETRHLRVVQARFLAIGVGFAALSRAGAPFGPGGISMLRVSPQMWPVASILAALLLLAAAGALLRGMRRENGHAIAPLLGMIGLILVVFHAVWSVTVPFYPTPLGLQLYASYYPMRWLVFGLIVGYGILRYQLFDFELRVRQTVALGVALLVGVAVAVALAAAAYSPAPGSAGSPLTTARAVGILAGAALVPPFWWAADRALGRLWPGSNAVVAYRVRRLEIYQATLESAFAKPDWGAEERRFVETLREVFEVTDEEHERVVRALRGRPTD